MSRRPHSQGQQVFMTSARSSLPFAILTTALLSDSTALPLVNNS